MGTRPPGPVTCEFFDLDAEIVLRVTSAVVDQMCAYADVDAALLAAIEVPIVEVIDALTRIDRPIPAVGVTIEAEQTLCIHVSTDLTEDTTPASLLGDALELVESFFDEEVSVDAHGIVLRGRLG